MIQLVKYGDLYLRLYRKSEDEREEQTENDRKTLNEDVILKAFKDNDPFIEYTDMHRNPAEVFELQKRGKTVGYIRTHLPDMNKYNTDDYLYARSFLNRYKFNSTDVDLYPADSFVHACLVDPNTKYVEEVVLGDGQDEAKTVTYTVRRGRSLLYDAYKIWKTLSLLENAVLLNRLTKSSVVKVVGVNTGDMDKTKVRPYLQQLRQAIEAKVAIDVGNNMTEGTTYSPVENMIFLPTHDDKNTINVTDIGSAEVNPKLDDIDYFRKKLFSALGIPGAYLGEDDGNSGFDSGTNLTLKSSQFAKKIKRLQNALIQAITDEINLILLDKHLYTYINEFTIMMQAPLTQEEKDRKDALTTTISGIDNVMNLMANNGIEDPITKLRMLRILLSDAGLPRELLEELQKEIDKMEEGDVDTQAEGEEDMGGGLGGMGGAPMDLGGGEDMSMDLGAEAPAEEPVDLGAEADIAAPTDTGEAPIEGGAEEGFLQPRGERVLNERNSLPSWHDLGMSYTDVNLSK